MVENRITSYKKLSNGSPLRMLPRHKKATSTVSINCSKVNDSFVTPNNIQNDFLYDFPDDFSSMVPLWFLQCSSNVPPIGGGGGGQTSGNSAKTGLCMQQIKKVRKAVYTCLSTAFGALSNKKGAGQQFIWLIFLVRRSETSPDVTVRL